MRDRDVLRSTVLAMTNPWSQRYVFCRYVLGEPRRDAAAMAGALAPIGMMDGDEYDLIVREREGGSDER